MGPDGGIAPAKRYGYCAAHSNRVDRNGDPGTPGPRRRTKSNPNGNRRGARQDARAESFLELPARHTWAALLVLRPGHVAVQWPDGTRQRIPQPRLEAWRRRGWVSLPPLVDPRTVRELTIVPGARAAARRVLETTARNRAKFGVRIRHEPGSDEA